MTWWQTLFIAVAPAAVAAGALVWQHHINAESARALHGLQAQASRRDEKLAAHRHALTRLSAMHDVLRTEASVMVRAMLVAAHEPRPDVIPVPHEIARAAEDAVSEVALLCDKQSAIAAVKYRASLVDFGLALSRPEVTLDSITSADRACSDASVDYLMAAKTELDTR
ncbi:hypothetical protein [Cellulomonas iranensis]|uniref:hypothetical protein n=1 Tax=Cellulomonas iranensis TaxID=76862 RepID=UPI00117813CB|nr:hypothetical protein [Cellulomonas iranensis]